MHPGSHSHLLFQSSGLLPTRGSGGDSWSTPSSRISQLVGPLFLLAWPVALAGALISLFALLLGTARRRLAVSGLVLGSGVAIGQVLLELGLLVGGGD